MRRIEWEFHSPADVPLPLDTHRPLILPNILVLASDAVHHFLHFMAHYRHWLMPCLSYIFYIPFHSVCGSAGFPGGSEVKTSACNEGDLGSILGLGRSSGEGNGNPLQCSCLESPIDSRAWWAAIYGVAQSRTRLKRLSSMDYTVYGILQARILEWVAFPFSRGSSQPKDRTQVSCIARGFFTS